MSESTLNLVQATTAPAGTTLAPAGVVQATINGVANTNIPMSTLRKADGTDAIDALIHQKAFCSTPYTDDAGNYYQLHEIFDASTGARTTEIVNPTTNAIVSPGAGFRPCSSVDHLAVDSKAYQVIGTGTNAQIDNTIYRVAVENKSTGTTDLVYWTLASGASVTGVVSEGVGQNVEPQDERVTLQSTDIGTSADSAASNDTGAFSLIALVKRGLQNWTSLLARVPVLGQALASASSPVVLPQAQIDAIKPPSSMPLGTTDSTALATISNAQGSAGTTPPALATGASGILGFLRGIYDRAVDIISNLQAQKSVSDTVWIDAGNANAAVIRRSVGTISGVATSFFDVNGNPYIVAGALTPAVSSGSGGGSSATTNVVQSLWRVKTAFDTYTVDQVLRRLDVTNIGTGAISATAWTNFGGTALSGAALALVSESTVEPIGRSVGVTVGGNAASVQNGIPAICGASAPSTLTINNATALSTALTISTVGMKSVMFSYTPTGTITGGVLTFEVNNGNGEWFTTRGVRESTPYGDTAPSLNGLTAQVWSINVANKTQFRARLSTAVVGTGSASLVATAGSADVNWSVSTFETTQPLPGGGNTIGNLNSITQAVGITNAQITSTADIPTAAVTASGDSAIITHGRGLSFVAVFGITSVTGTATVDLTLQQLIDGTNWVPIYTLPRFTAAAGAYSFPALPIRSGQFKITQTFNGTGYSISRNVTQYTSQRHYPLRYNFIDRSSLVISTGNSVTPTYFCEGANKFILSVGPSTIVSAVGAIQLQVGYGTDNAGSIIWQNVGGVLTCSAAGGFIAVDAPGARHVRAIVTTSASGSVVGPVTIKGLE